VAYEARREYYDEEELDKAEKKAQNDAANQKAVMVAADVASKSGNPYATAIGKGVQIADRVTGGKVSELGGKALTAVNKASPIVGGLTQGITNKVANSKAADAAYKAYNAKKGKTSGGEQASSPSSADKAKVPEKKTPDDKKTPAEKQNEAKKPEEQKKDAPSGGAAPEADKEKEQDTDDSKSKSSFLGKGLLAAPVIVALIPIFLILMLFLGAVLLVGGVFGDFQDAFGVSEISEMDTGGMEGMSDDPEQNAFYRRVNEVRMDYQADGKEIDPLIFAGTYHALSNYSTGITYESMTTSKLKEIADATLNNDVYDKEYFKSELKSKIIPSYFPIINEDSKDVIVNDIFEYIDNYNDLIGKKMEEGSSCYDGGSCTYDIKGYRLSSTKTSKKSEKVSNLYVRLMQCGKGAGRDYGGTFGQPIAGEELVPFEKYVLGAAYAEMGTNTEQAFKSQLVVARSFTLARHADVGGWRKLTKEGDKWVLQLGNCTLDQLYCDPDKGCSRDSTSSGYQLHTGTTGYARKYKDPLPENSPYRKYAKETAGEVLVDNNGYIIQAGFLMAENNKFTNLAKSGYNYKQILLSVYNSGNRKYGASNIDRADCSATCADSSEAAGWKQYEGNWTSVKVGTSGKTIKQIGCLATALSIQIARSGVPTNISGEFNPGTFVEYLNTHGGFYGGNLNWSGPTAAAPTFKYQNRIYLSGMNRQQKLNKIKEITSQPGVYAVCEVKGNTGQHWVAIDRVDGNGVKMMDPGSSSTDMWNQYNWVNTSQIVYYRVG